jgi:hypothetical protein
MRSGTGRHAPSMPSLGTHLLRAGLASALACSAAGCVGDGSPLVQAQLKGPAVAFESIDGPPLGIFYKLVADLSNEAQKRQILVVSREGGDAAYRVRGYVAALTTQGQTHIGWVWDVYDAQKHRAFRITGEEAVPGRTGDIWAVLTDEMLERIARQSMDRLVAFLATPEAPPASRETATAFSED